MLKTTVVGSALDRLVALEVAGLVLLPGRGPRMYYRRVGDAFARDSSMTGKLAGVDDTATLDFELPASAVDYLRFELPAIAGCYRMGPVVIGGSEVENLSRRVMAVHGRRVPDPDSTSEIRLTEWTGAPWFELDVRDLLGGGRSAASTAVRVTIRKEHAAIEMERRLDVAIAELARQLKEHKDGIGSRVAEAAASLALAQHSSENRLAADVGAKIDGAASESAERLDGHVREISASMATQTETFRQEVAALRQSLDAMRGQIDFLLQYELNRSIVRRALRRVKRWVWK